MPFTNTGLSAKPIKGQVNSTSSNALKRVKFWRFVLLCIAGNKKDNTALPKLSKLCYPDKNQQILAVSLP